MSLVLVPSIVGGKIQSSKKKAHVDRIMQIPFIGGERREEKGPSFELRRGIIKKTKSQTGSCNPIICTDNLSRDAHSFGSYKNWNWFECTRSTYSLSLPFSNSRFPFLDRHTPVIHHEQVAAEEESNTAHPFPSVLGNRNQLVSLRD